MLASLRNGLKPLFRYLAFPFILFNVSPMMVTLLGLPFAVGCAYAFATQNWTAALVLLPLAGLWDAIDGTVARALNKQSLWGNYFETMIDKLVEIIVFIGLSFVAPVAAIVALGLGLLSSYAKPRVALVIITDNHDWPAIGEHADKMALLWVGTLVSIFYPFVEILSLSTIETTLWVIALVSFVGTIQRVGYAKGLIHRAEKEGNVLPYLKSGKER